MKTCFRVMILVVLGVWLSVGARLPVLAAPAPQDAGLQLRYNDTVQSEIDETRTEETWEFTGNAGDLILVDMRADGSNLDAYLTLLDPFGSPLASDDDSGEGLNARVGPYRLPSSGIYSIVAGRYGGAGGYLLELKHLGMIPTLMEQKPLTGLLDSSHPTDYFLLPAGTPESLWQVSVVDDQLRSDPYLSLYGASGLISSTEPTSASTIDPIVPLPDQAYVLVVSWNTTSSGGPYQIELRPSEADLLDVGAPQTATLDYLAVEQQHYFRGDEGEPVHLSIEAEGEIALAVEVTTLDGSRVLFSGSGDASRTMAATLVMPQSAVYVVSVWDGSYSGETGTYTISLER